MNGCSKGYRSDLPMVRTLSWHYLRMGWINDSLRPHMVIAASKVKIGT